MKLRHICVMFCLAALSLQVQAQDLSRLRGTTPLQITGRIGTQNTFNLSSTGYSYRSPWSNTLFANLNLNVYGFDIPLSFHLSNNNRAFSHPFAHFGMSPRYRNVRFHIGHRNMSFSPYTYSGLTFLGGGVEVDWKMLRLAFFSGNLNQARAIESGSFSGNPYSYRRSALGVKLGVGNARNHVDLIIFNARDDSTSIVLGAGQFLQPRENLVVGSTFRFNLGRHVVLTSNIAASAYNENMRSSSAGVKELQGLDKFFTLRYGSVLRYAGDMNMHINIGRARTSLQYRIIQPEFYSLGTTYMTNNVRRMGMNIYTPVLDNKVFVNLGLHHQTDNITNTQLYTSSGLVLSLNATARLSEQLTITGVYNGFNQQQRDGTAQVMENLRINRVMHNFNLSPVYNFRTANKTHSVNGLFNGSISRNMNKQFEDPSNTTSLAVGAGYTLTLDESNTNIMVNFNHQNSSSSFYDFSSNNLGLGFGRRFLKEENLNMQVNTTLAYSQVNQLTRNLSVMTGLNASYTYQKNHTANLRLGFNNIRNFHMEGLYSINGYHTSISFGYSYRIPPVTPGKRGENASMN